MHRIALLLATLLISTPVLADDMKMPRIITVTGQADRKVVPDEAHINVNLNSMEMKLVDAKTAHDVKLKKLLSIVKANGIAEKKIKTQSSTIQPVYSYINVAQTGVNKRKFEGYRVQTTIDLTVTEIAKIGEVMDAISQAGFEKGANTEWGDLMNMSYNVSEPDKIRDEILVEAIKNARAKAERMVGAAGASLGRVYSINESGVNMPMPMPMMAMAKMADGGGTMEAAVAPPAGEQEVNANVTVSFELKD